ncbi:MAG: ribosome biogenesis GTP-binding protein YihA/YsxC [Pseudomonadota bacterium]
MNSKEPKAINLEGRDLNYNPELEENAERLFKAPCNFVIGTTDYAIFPSCDIPEFAFIGRSNVGKSSLLNALVNQKGLARVSVTPGRTQQVNFFQLGSNIRLVDLPGYGFAKAPKNLVKSWERMSVGYLKNRINLKRLFLLIDARHGFKANDLEFMQQLDKHAINYQVVLTKLDKTNKEQIQSIISFAKEDRINHASMFPDIILTSSKKKNGIMDLRTYIYNANQ